MQNGQLAGLEHGHDLWQVLHDEGCNSSGGVVGALEVVGVVATLIPAPQACQRVSFACVCRHVSVCLARARAAEAEVTHRRRQGMLGSSRSRTECVDVSTDTNGTLPTQPCAHASTWGEGTCDVRVRSNLCGCGVRFEC